MRVYKEDFPLEAVLEKAKAGSLRAIYILHELKTKGFVDLEDKYDECELQFN